MALIEILIPFFLYPVSSNVANYSMSRVFIFDNQLRHLVSAMQTVKSPWRPCLALETRKIAWKTEMKPTSVLAWMWVSSQWDMAVLATNMSGHIQNQLTRSLERILEDAHLSGELKLSGRKLKEFPKASSKYNLSDTVTAGS